MLVGKLGNKKYYIICEKEKKIKSMKPTDSC